MEVDKIPNQIKDQLTELNKTFAWAVSLAVIFAWSGLQGDEEIKALGLTIQRPQAFFVACVFYLFVNIQILLRFLRISNLIDSIDGNVKLEAKTLIRTHQWLANPLSNFGDSTNAVINSAMGYGLLILSWWVCNTSLYLLMDNIFSIPNLLLQVGFLILGLSSMRVIDGIRTKLRALSNEESSSQNETYFKAVNIGALLGVVSGALFCFFVNFSAYSKSYEDPNRVKLLDTYYNNLEEPLRSIGGAPIWPMDQPKTILSISHWLLKNEILKKVIAEYTGTLSSVNRNSYLSAKTDNSIYSSMSLASTLSSSMSFHMLHTGGMGSVFSINSGGIASIKFAPSGLSLTSLGLAASSSSIAFFKSDSNAGTEEVIDNMKREFLISDLIGETMENMSSYLTLVATNGQVARTKNVAADNFYKEILLKHRDGIEIDTDEEFIARNVFAALASEGVVRPKEYEIITLFLDSLTVNSLKASKYKTDDEQILVKLEENLIKHFVEQFQLLQEHHSRSEYIEFDHLLRFRTERLLSEGRTIFRRTGYFQKDGLYSKGRAMFKKIDKMENTE